MNWARTLDALASDPAVNAVNARWFYDGLGVLGRLFTGVAETTDPSWDPRDAQPAAGRREKARAGQGVLRWTNAP